MSNLNLNFVNKSYNKKKTPLKKEHVTVLKDINIDFQTSEVIGIIGLNGEGKTTLLKAIAKDIELDSGEVSLDGKDFEKNVNEVLLIPDKNILPENMILKDIIELLKKNNKNYDEDYALDFINSLKINLNSKISNLSKGNKELVQLGLLIANKPKFLLLDEPLASIDVVKRDFIYERIIDLQMAGVGIIITSHIISEIQEIFSRIVLLERGVIKEDKSLEEIRAEGYTSLNEYVISKLKV